MSDLCGSSENLISIVNYTLRRKGECDDKKTTASIGTASITRQIAMSSNDAAEEPSSTSSPPESRQEKNDAGGGDDNDNDNNSDGGDAEQEKEGFSENKEDGSTNEADSEGDDDREEDGDTDLISAVTDLSDVTRRICVVTTAALPWRYVKNGRRTTFMHSVCGS